MIASMLELEEKDIRAEGITDPYSIHRVVYSLFDDIRTEKEKQQSLPSGILYIDKGWNGDEQKVLIFSNRSPRAPSFGKIVSKYIEDSFLQNEAYFFEVVLNPTKREKATRKLVPVRKEEELIQWFFDRAENTWGFKVNPNNLEIRRLSPQRFKKGERGCHMVTQSRVLFTGEMEELNHQKFIKSFKQGIGRGRAFGLGLLQIVPTQRRNNETKEPIN